MKKIKYIIALSLFTTLTKAQVQSYEFYNYTLNNMYNVNPAYTGNQEGVNAIINAHAQSKGVANANKNAMLGLHSRFASNQGLGLRLISDTRGAFQNLKCDFTYAYRAKLAEHHILSLGLSAGVYNKNISINRIENSAMLDQNDPTLNTTYYNATQFLAGLGLLYTYKGLEVSISAPHIIETAQPVNQYSHAAVFYTFRAGKDFKITPWASFQKIPVTKSLGALYVKGLYKDILWVQAGYQTNDMFSSSFGANLGNFGLGYGFRMSNAKFKSISAGSHELVFSLRVNKKDRETTTNTSNSTTSNRNNLASIIAKLDNLLDKPVTNQSKSEIRSELEKIKIQLRSVELDNDDPAKAQEAANQLKAIDEKLKQIEKNLNDAK